MLHSPLLADLPPYTVTRKRIRTLRLTVKAPHGDVHVSAPPHVSERSIAAFVAEKAAWIAKHQERVRSQPAPLQAGPETERLRRQLRRDAPPLIAYWADRMNLPVPTLSVRRMTSRWGSCNPQQVRMSLNLELARRDPELLEYVIVHELAHLIETGHNQRFYAVMDQYLPDWRAKRKALNGR
jgi:predicted metal-dependent hydrolase